MKTIITHSGAFHNDEVLAVAIIKMAHPNEKFKIIRTRDREIIENGKLDDDTYVVDVGMEYIPTMNVFDHHQTGWEGWFKPEFNRTPTASCGQVWKHLGYAICNYNGELYDKVYENLIEEVDRQDNGLDPIGRGPQFQVTGFNPSWNDDSNGDEEFLVAVDIAAQFLNAAIKRQSALLEASNLHESTLKSQKEEDKGLFIMNTYYPWTSYLVGDHPYTFVVYPRRDGDWAIQSIPTGEGFENKGSLPKSWIEGPVEDMIFCHKALFIASFTTRERAIEMAKEAIALL